jgi:uncharacterized protein (TIGR01777 family)
LHWDGKTFGDWIDLLDRTDVLINLAGRRVHCRYNEANLKDMMDSRIQSTEIIGQAISQCKNPPSLWLQSSTATIYAHTFGEPNDEQGGVLGGHEPDVPPAWNYSIKIAKNWESAFHNSNTPATRKVAMRSAIMMGIDKDSAFDIFSRLARLGLGGQLGSGKQFVSWIHETDLGRAVEFLIEHSEIIGNVNIASPNPLPQAEFAKGIQRAWNVPFGLPATPWMINLGAWILNGDSELVMKSRRVISSRLKEGGFTFLFPNWPEAAKDLVSKMRLQSVRTAS